MMAKQWFCGNINKIKSSDNDDKRKKLSMSFHSIFPIIQAFFKGYWVFVHKFCGTRTKILFFLPKISVVTIMHFPSLLLLQPPPVSTPVLSRDHKNHTQRAAKTFEAVSNSTCVLRLTSRNMKRCGKGKYLIIYQNYWRGPLFPKIFVSSLLFKWKWPFVFLESMYCTSLKLLVGTLVNRACAFANYSLIQLLAL